MPATILGLTIAQSLVAIGAILVVADLFFLSDLPTMAAYLAFAGAIALQFDVPVLVRVLVGVVAFVGLILFHYAVWRGVFRRISERAAPGKFKGSVDRVVGLRGVIRLIEGRSMVSVAGELWDHEPSLALPDGTPVEVLARHEATLTVRALRAASPAVPPAGRPESEP